MNSTPNSNRKHIVLYGKRNAGKSSILNFIMGQEVSLVSNVAGTTTDPVSKAMELLNIGPVLFIDTAGLDDEGDIGELRVKKSLQTLNKADLAIYVLDSSNIDLIFLDKTIIEFKKYNIPYIIAFNKIDKIDLNQLNILRQKYKEAVFISTYKNQGINSLYSKIELKIKEQDDEISIMNGILKYNSNVILVVPIDSEAPKGRLILPQVQVIRDCLDNGIKTCVVRDTELEDVISNMKNVDMVITDSQAFKRVSSIVPKSIPLTSFSILFARQKGDLEVFVKNVQKINELDENSKVLITETCTHNHSHEDIGRVKIPSLINKFLGKTLNYEFSMGMNFPEDILKYDLIIHCGACMVNRRTILNRINKCKEAGVAITNYGITLAYLTGILDRSIEIFANKKE